MKEEKQYNYHVLCIGAGGTASYFLKEISRFIAYLDVEKKKRIKSLAVIDGDLVETKNLSRQAFFSEDEGWNKATVQACQLNEAFFEDDSLNWNAYPTYVTTMEELDAIYQNQIEKGRTSYYGNTEKVDVPFIIGCVDNDGCRMLCEEYFNQHEDCIYFDSGNEMYTGEVIFAYKFGGKVLSPVSSTYFPQMKAGDLRQITEISCTELNASAPQHIFTNMEAGLNLCKAFSILIEENKLVRGYTYYNTRKFVQGFVKAGISDTGDADAVMVENKRLKAEIARLQAIIEKKNGEETENVAS